MLDKTLTQITRALSQHALSKLRLNDKKVAFASFVGYAGEIQANARLRKKHGNILIYCQGI